MSKAKDNIQPDKIDNITKAKNRISELESEKAELIEFIKNILEYSYVVGGGVRDCKDILKKHGVEK